MHAPSPVPDAMLSVPGQHAGLVRPGNVDLRGRPQVMNADGSFSTVRSMSIGLDGHEVLIPTVIRSGGKWIVADPQTAIDHYRKTGEHLGVFASPETANAYAKALHQQQAAMYAYGGHR